MGRNTHCPWGTLYMLITVVAVKNRTTNTRSLNCCPPVSTSQPAAIKANRNRKLFRRMPCFLFLLPVSMWFTFFHSASWGRSLCGSGEIIPRKYILIFTNEFVHVCLIFMIFIG